MEKKYHIVTYGCQMNVHESEKMAGILRRMGYIETEKTEDADLILFNTELLIPYLAPAHRIVYRIRM